MSTHVSDRTPAHHPSQPARPPSPPQNSKPATLSASDRSKRSRMACTACRKRKVRCDGPGDSGSCPLCVQTGQNCVFVQASRRGPPKGYVESLEQRLEAMEALLQSLSSLATHDNLKSLQRGQHELDQIRAGAESLRMASAGHDSFESPLEMSQPAVDNLQCMDELADELDQLSVDKDRYVGRGSGLHLAHSFNVMNPAAKIMFTAEEDSQPSLVEQMIQQDHRKAIKSRPLPPADLAEQLVEAYFSQLNSIFALLHRPSFDRAIRDGLLDTDGSFRALYFIVCALGARIVHDERLIPPPSPSHPNGQEQSRGFELFRAATEAASPALISATLYDLQMSVLLVLWLLGSTGPITAWGAVGYAVRRLVDVGAHRERRARWTTSPLEDQLRKRAFHFLFGLDRMISVGLGRPLAMQEEDFDVQQPIDISDEDLDAWNANPAAGPAPPPGLDKLTTLSCLKAFFALSTIQGEVLKKLYGMKVHMRDPQKTAEVVLHLDSLLNAWLEKIPQPLRWNPHEQNNNTVALSVALYSSYYSTQILVHREFLSPGQSRVVGFPSLAICSNAARSMANVLNTLRQRNMLASAFWYAPMLATTAGLILLINVYSGASSTTKLTDSALNDVKRVINVLGVMAEDNFVARKCFIALTRLVASAADARPLENATTISPLSNGSAPAPANGAMGSSLKRANPFGWLDGESPASAQIVSSGASSSSSPTGLSPKDIDDGGERATIGHRNKRERRESATLPQTTNDLSLETFNGRPTFSFNIKAALQSGDPGPILPFRGSTDTGTTPELINSHNNPISTGQMWPGLTESSGRLAGGPHRFGTDQTEDSARPAPATLHQYVPENRVPRSQAGLANLGRAVAPSACNVPPPFDFEAAMAAASGTAAPIAGIDAHSPSSSIAPIDAILMGQANAGAHGPAALGSLMNFPPLPGFQPAAQSAPFGRPLQPLGPSIDNQQDDLDMFMSMGLNMGAPVGANVGMTTPSAHWSGGLRTATGGSGAYDPNSSFDFGQFSSCQPDLTAGLGGGDMWDRSMLGDFDFSAFSSFSPAAYAGESYFQCKPAAQQQYQQ